MKYCVPPLVLADRVITTEKPAFIMGILNVTPDSFWKNSRKSVKTLPGIGTYISKSQSIETALEMIEDGADIIDIGGESSRPGAQYVSTAEELKRVIPIVEGIKKYSVCPISVDTRKSEVLEAAVQAGADILNDISALEDDPVCTRLAAEKSIPVILMHKRGSPVTMQQNTAYCDVVMEVTVYLRGRTKYALDNGIQKNRIILDAGIGFGKSCQDNIRLIKSSSRLCAHVHPDGPEGHIVMALSRKTCIGDMTGAPVAGRLAGTLAANLIAVQWGATILRVHDVAETRQMLDVLGSMA